MVYNSSSNRNTIVPFGLFQRLREKMLINLFSSFLDLASRLKPHSEEMADLFKDVNVYGNIFIFKNRSIFDLWQSEHTFPAGDTSSQGSYENIFFCKTIFGWKIKGSRKRRNFRTLFRPYKNSKYLRGDVINIFSYISHWLNGSTPQDLETLC